MTYYEGSDVVQPEDFDAHEEPSVYKHSRVSLNVTLLRLVGIPLLIRASQTVIQVEPHNDLSESDDVVEIHHEGKVKKRSGITSVVLGCGRSIQVQEVPNFRLPSLDDHRWRRVFIPTFCYAGSLEDPW